jgi:hypothetical protein
MEIPKRWWNNEPIESVKKDYDDRLDHMIIFQRCPYNRPQDIVEDATFVTVLLPRLLP